MKKLIWYSPLPNWWWREHKTPPVEDIHNQTKEEAIAIARIIAKKQREEIEKSPIKFNWRNYYSRDPFPNR